MNPIARCTRYPVFWVKVRVVWGWVAEKTQMLGTLGLSSPPSTFLTLKAETVKKWFDNNLRPIQSILTTNHDAEYNQRCSYHFSSGYIYFFQHILDARCELLLVTKEDVVILLDDWLLHRRRWLFHRRRWELFNALLSLQRRIFCFDWNKRYRINQDIGTPHSRSFSGAEQEFSSH